MSQKSSEHQCGWKPVDGSAGLQRLRKKSHWKDPGALRGTTKKEEG
jgi:hypothetical protein